MNIVSKITAAVVGSKAYRAQSAERLKTEEGARAFHAELFEKRESARKLMVDEASSTALRSVMLSIDAQIDAVNAWHSNLRSQRIAADEQSLRGQKPQLQQAEKAAAATREAAAARMNTAAARAAQCRARLEPVEQEADSVRKQRVAEAQGQIETAEEALVKAEAEGNDAEAMRAADLVALGREALERAQSKASAADLRVPVLRDQLGKAEAEVERLQAELTAADTALGLAKLEVLAFEHDELVGRLAAKSVEMLAVRQPLVRSGGRRVPNYNLADPKPLVAGRAPTVADLMVEAAPGKEVDMAVFDRDPAEMIFEALAPLRGLDGQRQVGVAA